MEAPPTEAPPKSEPFEFSGRQTKATKQAMLASNHFTTQESSLRHYNDTSKPVEIVDLAVKGLPENCEARKLKEISGSKHVISATVEEDNMKGICNGNGRIKLRLNGSETVDQVMLNFANMGLEVKPFE